ncbi:hypothetical protein OF117_13160 [Geodermatophilus sp. YIM 151500]|uniref:AMIN-like domain-containing (lipo)protein n=1 Tax=Geodermatophilus sp. YIM 151500 TaxID=2984531 RepID=UPI0021E376BF|nr:hypothetical protein [Geodermatophilus sp. YIM 151500]MCV2490312.1 hypothetical protein [Geodermatophilus sp. YIM 151500]
MYVRRAALLASSLSLVLLTACAGSGDLGTAAGGGDAPSSAPATGGAGPASPSAGGDTSAPPFPADATPDTAEPSADSQGTVTDIRLGRHDGFDRIVLELGGTGTPGWDVRYVDAPSSQGSGDAVDVAGGAVLQVTLTGTAYPYATGVEEYAADAPLTDPAAQVVTEVVFDATFEGQTVTFVGVQEEVPFRVYSLADPTRIVVEVADPA